MGGKSRKTGKISKKLIQRLVAEREKKQKGGIGRCCDKKERVPNNDESKKGFGL